MREDEETGGGNKICSGRGAFAVTRIRTLNVFFFLQLLYK